MEHKIIVSNAFGYYLTPLIWIETSPRFGDAPDKVRHLGVEIHKQPLADGTVVRVTSDGLFMFDFTGSRHALVHDEANFDWEAAHDKIVLRLQIMNAHLACLYTAVSENGMLAMQKKYLTHADLIFAETLNAPILRFGGPAVTALVVSQNRHFYQAIPYLNDLGSMGRGHTIALQQVMRSFELLSGILAKGLPNRALRFSENLLRACVAYETDNTGAAVVDAWTVLEDYLVFMWLDVMAEGVNDSAHTEGEKRTANRWKENYDANEGATPALAPLLNFLQREGRIDEHSQADLTAMHDARSKWVHRGQRTDEMLAFNTMTMAAEVLGWTEGIHFRILPVKRETY